MRQLPVDDPGQPDFASPNRLLWWMAKQQLPTLLGGMFFGIVWMCTLALVPFVIGRAIDRGVAAQDLADLRTYVGWFALLSVINAASGIMRHRFAVTNWLSAAYRTIQVVGRHAAHLGATLPRHVATGEVVAIGTNDVSNMGSVMDVTARFSGAIVSYLMVSVLLLRSSVTLGLVVLIGVPVLMASIAPLLKPLERRSAVHRELVGELANTANDIVSGLRILRGIGGEAAFLARYRAHSQRTREAGVHVARMSATLDSLQVLLPGIFVVIVVWLSARQAVLGTIGVGELVAFYGYAAFLMMPLRTITEYANKFIRARVTARRICRLLALHPDVASPVAPAAEPPPGATLADAASGLQITAGQLWAVVSDDPDSAAALADRLSLMAPEEDPSVTLGNVPLGDLDRVCLRRRILTSDTGATLFSGTVASWFTGASDEEVTAALTAAAATDIIDSLPEGLATEMAERGRTLSGGQRQRMVLARALIHDPEILILVEPTSAVDAHTEAMIAARLSAARADRTTVLITASPLLLERTDQVAWFTDGRVAAVGTHHELLAAEPAYAAVVYRGAEEEL